MGYLLHLHRYTAVYKWLFPLITAVSIGVLALACWWQNGYFWAVIMACILVLVAVSVQWVVLLWGMAAISLTADHPYDYNYTGSNVRLCDFEVANAGTVKVLEIDHIDAKHTKEGAYVEVGEALAPALIKMRWGMWVFYTLITSIMLPADIDRLLEMLPDVYLRELTDFAHGIQQFVPANCFMSRWTARDWFVIQLIPDLELLVSNTNPCQGMLKRILEAGNEKRVRVHRPAIGCTALLTEQGFYRNMDWPSLGLMGHFTLLIRRRYIHTGAVSLEVGVPGLVGTVTGVISWDPIGAPQNNGMLAMNVCCPHNEAKWIEPGHDYIPASYVNRAVMAKLVDDGCAASDIHSLSEVIGHVEPLAPYHVTFAKFQEGVLSGVVVHCRQDGQDRHAYRRYPQSDSKFLLTCNGNLTERNETDSQTSCFTVHAHDLMHTNIRTTKIQEYIAAGELDGRNILSQHPINNHETCYFVALESSTLELRVNNAFGASSMPIDITSALLTSREQ